MEGVTRHDAAVDNIVAPVVDVHSHVIPSALPDLRDRHPFGRWPGVAIDGDQGTILVDGAPFRRVDARCWSAPARVADLDASGIDVQVVSPVPITLCHDAPAAGAAVLARAQNDFLAGFVADAPDRFAAFGAVPLQDVAGAVTELEYCMGELGFAGVEIGTAAGDTELADPHLRPFFAAAEAFGAVVFVHPDRLGCGARLVPWSLEFGVGMPCETATAAAALLCSGRLAELPRLDLLLAHGGGALPWLLPRMDKGWEILPARAERLPEPPSHWARRLWVDSLTYDAGALWLATERFGAGHVMLGTDSPFAAREEPAGAAIREASDRGLLGDDSVRAILGGNAADRLRLPGPAVG